MKYKASLDKLAKIVTLVVTLLFVAIIVAQYPLIKTGEKLIPLCITFSLLLIYFMVFYFSPVSYSITENEIIINRHFNKKIIIRKDIKTMAVLDRSKLKWSIRILGVGGLFGYFGKFTNRELGTMTWYATRRDRGVLIHTVYNKNIMITPDDPAKFVADFNK